MAIKKLGSAPVFILLVLTVFFAAAAQAQDVTLISDILTDKSRYWNTEVTVFGHVQTVAPVQSGSSRGTYTLLDDSGPTPLTIRTNDLPPVGKDFTVTGVIVQDSGQADAPIMKELSRAASGMPAATLALLLGAAALFLILLIVFVVLLAKPGKRPAAGPPPPPPAVPPPSMPPPSLPPDLSRTTKLSAGEASAGALVFVNLNADVVVERGPEKGKEFALTRKVTTIGRHGTRRNDVEIHDDTVSKEQASIHYDDIHRQFVVVNESATNPTRVNGVVIVAPTLLENGTLIEMGRTVLLFRKG
jgi:hypothetical protein